MYYANPDSEFYNIHAKGNEVKLLEGTYYIYITGGWGIRKNDFRIKLHKKDTLQKLQVERSRWPVQSWGKGKRLKRVYNIQVKDSGTYMIDIINPESIEVRRSNLFMMNLIESPIPNDDIEVFFQQI